MMFLRKLTVNNKTEISVFLSSLDIRIYSFKLLNKNFSMQLWHWSYIREAEKKCP